MTPRAKMLTSPTRKLATILSKGITTKAMCLLISIIRERITIPCILPTGQPTPIVSGIDCCLSRTLSYFPYLYTLYLEIVMSSGVIHELQSSCVFYSHICYRCSNALLVRFSLAFVVKNCFHNGSRRYSSSIFWECSWITTCFWYELLS